MKTNTQKTKIARSARKIDIFFGFSLFFSLFHYLCKVCEKKSIFLKTKWILQKLKDSGKKNSTNQKEVATSRIQKSDQ